MSPKKFIRLVRFNHALKYIYDMEEKKSLSYIAHEVGYDDQSHFIRDFKEICGKTPRQILVISDSLANKFRLFYCLIRKQESERRTMKVNRLIKRKTQAAIDLGLLPD